MEKQNVSSFSGGLLWFGAAVSIAEIFTGTLIAPLGISKGITAIILGHVIGVMLLYLAGLIGAESKLPAIESSRISFGKYGSYLFSILNILQLIGWTAVMIIVGAKSMDYVTMTMSNYSNMALWCIVIGALIVIWIIVGIKNLSKVNVFAVGGLFVLTIILSTLVFKSTNAIKVEGTMTFGMAFELSVIMPLSWLPLISDYTRFAKKARQSTLVSSLSYFVGSTWMYIIGFGAAIYTGTSDVAQIMTSAGLGIAAVIVIVFATVTTTFLDAYSAGVSFTNVSRKINEKTAAVIVCIVGILIAIFTPIEQYQDFLALIGSVFAPMITILIIDYFIFKKRDTSDIINISNIILWGVGVIIYRVFLKIDTIVGSTIPVIIIVGILYIILNGGKNYVRKSIRKSQ